MELVNHTIPVTETTYTIKGITGTTAVCTVGVSGDASNCKLSYIHRLGTLISFNDNQRKEIVNFVLKVCKGAVIINTTNKVVADWISKNYPTYFYNEVPIGYGSSFQYMLCIKNTIVINANCREPLKVKPKSIGVKIDTTALQKEVIKRKLVLILAEKRRKGDYVDEFINSL